MHTVQPIDRDLRWSSPVDEREHPAPAGRLQRIEAAIEHAAHLLPAQGPITVFIHHNTLHGFEHLPFDEAVQAGAATFGCQPYLSLDRYREELRRGRIRYEELEAVLREDLGSRADEKIFRTCTRFEFRLAMLVHQLRSGSDEELQWFVAETDALARVRDGVSATVRSRLIGETRRWVMRTQRCGCEKTGLGNDAPRRPAKRRQDDLCSLLSRFGESRIENWSESTWEAFTLQLLWRTCRDGISSLSETNCPGEPPQRHRDLLVRATGVDSDLLVHDLLIRFCAAYLDQGLASWRLPRRVEGFYRSFIALYGEPFGPPAAWLRGLALELELMNVRNLTPLESIQESLDDFGVADEECEEFISATLVALRGFAGMTRFLEERGDRALHAVPRGGLVEFLAIRLLLDRLAVAFVARSSSGFVGRLDELRHALAQGGTCERPSGDHQRAFGVFQLAQVLCWTPAELGGLDRGQWIALVNEIETFSAVQRQRIFHLAYERRFYTQTLDALCLHNRTEHAKPVSPTFQAMFCIDEREESIRRHLEEVAPDVETYGIAGFFFVPMYYRGVADAHFVPLCPAVILPSNWVVEKVTEDLEDEYQRRTRRRRALGKASHQVHIGSRGFARGALLSASTGVLASIPLVARTLFPRMMSRLQKAFGRLALDAQATELRLERIPPEVGSEIGQLGFSLDEMVSMAERVLRDTGIIAGFSRLVLTIGHGSTSMNNPHESAHDCGACGGSRGGPNGRAIAQMLNDPRVRERLAARGIAIPYETVFVGGMHNTSSETMTFYDLDRLPRWHREEFDAARRLLETACDRDSHERSRRFESAPLTLSFAAARQHVEGRAEDLAQVRPEWGHATNAVCIVGRRNRTRGLFLDRRAFLSSYDPSQDDERGSILTQILQAVVPVCAGISLEYYFSYVDNSGYGCGTKLPHNITSLLGVMDGAASDLRTGLPWQMVEIHEPVRILFVVETSTSTMSDILARNPAIGQLVENGWIRLATLDPNSPGVHVYRNGSFVAFEPQADSLPQADSSADWYRGWRDHLEFAQIGPTGESH